MSYNEHLKDAQNHNSNLRNRHKEIVRTALRIMENANASAYDLQTAAGYIEDLVPSGRDPLDWSTEP